MNYPGAVADRDALSERDLAIVGSRWNGYLVEPKAPGMYPGLVLIHEAFGLNEHIRDVARRIAAQGFTVLAPDLYTDVEPPNSSDLADVQRVMLSLSDLDVVRELDACTRYLRSLPSATGRVGCMGFCSGGRQTLLAACSGVHLDVAIDCWGGWVERASADHERTAERPTPVLDLVSRLGCPLMALYGEEDQNPAPATGEELRTRVANAGGPEVQVRVYKDAGHAFFADYRPTYREAPAFKAWEDIMSFLKHHLCRAERAGR